MSSSVEELNKKMEEDERARQKELYKPDFFENIGMECASFEIFTKILNEEEKTK